MICPPYPFRGPAPSSYSRASSRTRTCCTSSSAVVSWRRCASAAQVRLRSTKGQTAVLRGTSWFVRALARGPGFHAYLHSPASEPCWPGPQGCWLCVQTFALRINILTCTCCSPPARLPLQAPVRRVRQLLLAPGARPAQDGRGVHGHREGHPGQGGRQWLPAGYHQGEGSGVRARAVYVRRMGKEWPRRRNLQGRRHGACNRLEQGGRVCGGWKGALARPGAEKGNYAYHSTL